MRHSSAVFTFVRSIIRQSNRFGALGVITLTGCAVTPEPLTQQEIVNTLIDDKQNMYQHQEPIQSALTLGEVMARALRYNLEFRTERLKSAISRNELDSARYEMLPTLAAEAGFVSRNTVSASRSVSIFTDNETLEPSMSQDRDRNTGSLRFSWNLLDFGVSYLTAKQNADRYLISKGARDKVMSSIMLQAYGAYWSAYMAQELTPQVQKTLKQVKEAVTNIDAGLKAGAYRSPVEALQLKKQLLESGHELATLKDLLLRSKATLANLINMPPGVDFRLEAFKGGGALSFESIPTDTLELTALTNSADITEQIYNARIEHLESKKAIARMFPGIEVNYDSNYDSNSFTYNNHWGEAGLRISLSLFELASAKHKLKSSKVKKALVKQRRMAINMAVITQLNLALQQWRSAKRQQTQAQTMKEIDDKIAAITHQQAKGHKSVVEQVQAQVTALQSNMGFMSTRSDVAVAEGAVIFTMGLSPLPKWPSRYTLKQLARSIDITLHEWQQGKLALVRVDP